MLTRTPRPGASGPRHVRPPAVIFEVLGRPHDDVIVMFNFEPDAVNTVMKLPPWARHYDRAARVWFVHPGFVNRLAVELRRGGRIIVWRTGQAGAAG